MTTDEALKQMFDLIMRLTFTPKPDGTYRTVEEVNAIAAEFDSEERPADGPAPH